LILADTAGTALRPRRAADRIIVGSRAHERPHATHIHESPSALATSSYSAEKTAETRASIRMAIMDLM